MTQSDKNMAHEQLGKAEPHTKVVYVTPEMMSMGGVIKNIMRDLVRRNRLARFVIDEAHCVSQVSPRRYMRVRHGRADDLVGT